MYVEGPPPLYISYASLEQTRPDRYQETLLFVFAALKHFFNYFQLCGRGGGNIWKSKSP